MMELLPSAATIAGLLLVGAVAGVIRGLTGFGAALVMAPALTLLTDPVRAVVVTMVAICATNLPLALGARREAAYPTVGWFLAGCLPGLPLGVWLLTALPREQLEWAIGLSVIAAALLLSRPSFRIARLTRGGKLAAGALSGLMNGGVGMGGPPVILALLAAGVPAASSRATLILYFTGLNAVSVALMAGTGLIGAEALVWAALLVPTLALAQKAGEWLFRRGGDRHFRGIAIALLVATGVMALVH
ncbi:MAG: hypothetical protein RLY86_2679 [Pseudomonadota bacterium]|jgi:uncharacterized membrane protein YfcA